MGRLAYIKRLAKSVWGRIAALLACAGTAAFLRDEFAPPAWRDEMKWDTYISLMPWHWWAIGALAFAFVAVFEGAYREHKLIERQRRLAARTLAPGTYEECDACYALQYLLHESTWAWRTFREVNRWDMVDGLHLHEFRRGARDSPTSVRARGFPSNGGPPEPIDQTHWIGAEINPSTANTPNEVATQSLSPRHLNKPTFGGIRVSKQDVEDVWPKASRARRRLTTGWVKITLRWHQTQFDHQQWRTRRKMK